MLLLLLLFLAVHVKLTRQGNQAEAVRSGRQIRTSDSYLDVAGTTAAVGIDGVWKPDASGFGNRRGLGQERGIHPSIKESENGVRKAGPSGARLGHG